MFQERLMFFSKVAESAVEDRWLVDVKQSVIWTEEIEHPKIF